MGDRYAHLKALLGDELFQKVQSSKVLVVGAGGIGCELLKNLILTGFQNIEIIDLDTIDISNLNRQFLFRREHVGQSKAEVARLSALAVNPHVNIVARHDNVKSQEYGPSFLKQFDLVMNALDNLDARRHVNRLCLAAEIPLVESGTQGYLGQVTTIKHGRTECFECQPHPSPKTFPSCTIRDTPDRPVHTIEWAKSIFSTLFGPPDELNITQDLKIAVQDGKEDSYAKHLFEAFFTTRIEKQLEQKASEGRTWHPRPTPQPLRFDEVTNGVQALSPSELSAHDQTVLSVGQYSHLFVDTVQRILAEKKDAIGTLSFDKDDELSMNFVTAAANVRMFNYGIPLQSRFQCKGIAGNIVHAIASTNAVAAGLIVQEAVKVLNGKLDQCRTTWIRRTAPSILQPQSLDSPNPNCYVCGGQQKLSLTVDTSVMTLRELFDVVCKKRLCMNEPCIDVTSADNYIGVMGDHDEKYLSKPLAEPGVKIIDGALLNLTDDSQEFECKIIVRHSTMDAEKHPSGFILSDASQANSDAPVDGAAIQGKESTDAVESKREKDSSASTTGVKRARDEPEIEKDADGKLKKQRAGDDDDDEVVVL